MTASPTRRLAAVAGLLIALVAVTVSVGPAAAQAAPRPGAEGGTPNLRKSLEAASRGYLDAKAKLDSSTKRQLEYTLELRKIEAQAQSLTVEVKLIAAKAYRMGRLNGLAVLLNSTDPSSFSERMAGLDALAQRDGRQLQRYAEAHQRAEQAKRAIDREVRDQRTQVTRMAKRKQEAERALAAVGGGASGGFVSANSPLAAPAPRSGDGSWPRELCTVDDPTTGGCLTPRTLHAMRQAAAAGFTRHTSCFRGGGGGEHPQGRACDFAVGSNGFQNSDAGGGDKAYGDSLAGYLMNNAGRLGVLYVIWYRQIWMPGTGWRAYHGGGDPSAAHTNHVHLSVL